MLTLVTFLYYLCCNVDLHTKYPYPDYGKQVGEVHVFPPFQHFAYSHILNWLTFAFVLQVQLNEGGGYNKTTRIFSCPKSGLYLFTFRIAVNEAENLVDHYHMTARLMVNGVEKAAAVVYTYHMNQVLDGGNMAVVNLLVGDQVWLHSTGDYGFNWRASFTGFRISS